jgi:hypothetical protein
MSGPLPNLFYRILPNGTGWYWELTDSERAVLARGIEKEAASALDEAFAAAFERAKTSQNLSRTHSEWSNPTRAAKERLALC